MSQNYGITGRIVTTALSLLLTAGSSSAGELAYGAQAGLQYTDNVERRAADGTDETVGNAGFDFSYMESSEKVTAEIGGGADFRTYFSDTFKDEVLPGLNANLLVRIFPGRLNWSVEDRFGQISNSTLQSLNPGNRQNTNYFSTGPTLTFGLGSNNKVILDARYASNYYEERDIDNERLSAGLSFKRNIAKQRSLSLNIETERVEFDDSANNSDFDKQEAFVRFETAVPRGSVGLDVGATMLHDRLQQDTGFLARLNLNRQLRGDARVTFSYATQVSDAGNVFRVGQAGYAQNDDAFDLRPSSDPFRSDTVNLSYQYPVASGEFSARVGWLSETYENETSFDRDRIGAGATYEHRFSQMMSGEISANFSRQDFGNMNRDDDDLTLAIQVSRQLTSSVYLALNVQHTDRSSSNSSADYTELRGGFQVGYRMARGR